MSLSTPSQSGLKLHFTYTLIGLICVCYALTLLPNIGKPDPQPDRFLLGVFSFYKPLFEEGLWWQIITANLIHSSWLHLGSNAMGLYVFGQLLEPALGGKRLFFLSLTSGLLAMLFSWWFLPAPTLGASGIVYGWMATYLTIVLILEGVANPSSIWRNLRTLLGWGIALYFADAMDPSHHVNHWGHLGGACAGLFFGSVYAWKALKQQPSSN